MTKKCDIFHNIIIHHFHKRFVIQKESISRQQTVDAQLIAAFRRTTRITFHSQMSPGSRSLITCILRAFSYNMALLIFFVVHWYLSLFFQSFFHHRYSAHRICSMSPFWEKVFYVCCFITQGSSYISARTYGIMHRMHHAHTDTPEDPHSPQNSLNVLMMLLDTRNNYHGIHSGRIVVADKFKKDLPDWPAFDKLVHNWIVRVLCGAAYFGIYLLICRHWWQFLFFPLTLGMGAMQGVAVNWWAHKFGYRNYNVRDTSTNILPVDFIFWGEAYHNNHHRNPGRSNNAVRWFEVDMLYLAMRGMHGLGIIKLKPVALAAKKSNYRKVAKAAPLVDIPAAEEAIW